MNHSIRNPESGLNDSCNLFIEKDIIIYLVFGSIDFLGKNLPPVPESRNVVKKTSLSKASLQLLECQSNAMVLS